MKELNHMTLNTVFERYRAYRDSGVDWIGEIPEGWITELGKWLFLKEDRPIRKCDEIVTCFRDGQVTLRRNRRTSGFTNALQEHGYQGVREGDFVIHAMDAFAGAIGVSESDGKCTPVYSICTPRCDNVVHSPYYMYYLRTLSWSGFITSLAQGIRQRSTDFRFADFSKLTLPLPPLAEQKAIVTYIEAESSKIHKAISLQQKQIDKLKEYRQVLIDSAVTGKIKVC